MGRFVKDSANYLKDYFSNAVSPLKLPSAVGSDGTPASGSNPSTTGSGKNSAMALSTAFGVSSVVAFIILMF